MKPWILELVKSLNRKNADIAIGLHALKDKNLDFDDLDLTKEIVRSGRIFERKSTERKKRICFKKYYKKEGKTYFVVAEYHLDIITIVTVIKKKGKY